ncbi:MAG: protein tyrosine phosphatase [Alphaproteobacteria bacterium]|nr:protein tyrosine phosphatase [Alphaproteobacteria bacterium]
MTNKFSHSLIKQTINSIKYIVICVLLIAFLWTGYFIIYGNFHQVDKDFYRSAQLFSFNMPYYVEKNGIKSVLNLRGPSKKEWYTDEIKISNQYNIIHYDYGITDRKPTTMKQMDEILKIIDDAPKPILVHCKAGADRSSLIAALYLYSIKHHKNPEKEISIIYGHFPWLGSKTNAMDNSFEDYKRQHPQ